MRSVRNWAIGSAIAALILLSPVVAFLMVIAAEMLVDGLMEAGVTEVCAIAAVAIGWALFRRIWFHRPIVPLRATERVVSDEGAVAVPPS